MFKLIESDSHGIKEVLNNGKVIWRMKKSQADVLLREELLTIDISYSTTIVPMKYDDWDYIEVDGVKINRSDGRIEKYFNTTFILNDTSYRKTLLAHLNSSYTKAIVKFYKVGGGVILNRLPFLFANIVPQKVVA